MLDLSGDIEPGDRATERKAAGAIGWFALLFASILLLGFHVSVVAFLISYLRHEAGASWRAAFTYAAVVWLILFVGFDRILHIPCPEPYLLKWVGLLG